MRRFTGFHRWNNIPTRYRTITIITLALFLLSGILTSGLIAARAASQKPVLHLLHNNVPGNINGTQVWQFQTGGMTDSSNFEAVPTVANDIVYYSGAGDGYLYALNEKSGKPLWHFQIDSSSATAYTPFVANGIVYASSDTNTFYALNASNGNIVWQQTLSGSGATFASAPVVANSIVYIKSTNGLQAFNANDGTPLWTFSCVSRAAAAVAGNIVYIGTNDNYVDALNATSGALLWQYKTGGSAIDTPSVTNGIVYITSEDDNLYALNANSGNPIWHFQLGSCSTSCDVGSQTVANGIVYVMDDAGNLNALNANSGIPIWQYTNAESTAFVSNGTVYFYSSPSSSNFAMTALNASTGSFLWSYPRGNALASAPVVDNGVVFFGTLNSAPGSFIYVYAVTAPPPTGPQGTERLGGSNPSELGDCVSCAGDPIDTFSGNFSHSWVDFSIPGRGVPLLFSRTYNAQAAAQQGPFGSGWTDSYSMALTTDGSGNVTIQQEDGSTVTFTPNAPNGYSAPPRVLATLVQNSDGTYTFTRANQLQYVFNTSGQLVQEVDRNGYVTHLTYNASNQLTSITDPAGRALTLTYGSNGLVSQITDPINRSVSFQYDTNNNLVAATDVTGGITRFTYDTNHLLLTITDPRGSVITNVYDTNARVISQTDAMNRKTTFSYGASSTTITDPNGNVSVEQYSNGLLVSKTMGYGTPEAATITYTYDPLSLGVTSITDPNGHVWKQVLDASGNLLSATDPLKRTTTNTYDQFNDLTSVMDPMGVTTSYTYDSHGNLLTVSRPLNGTKLVQTMSYTYGDPSHPGDATAITDPNGKVWQYAYDQYGDVTSATDPLSNKTTIQYDTIGRATSQISPNGNVSGGNPAAYTTSYSYDAFGDVVQVTDPLGHQTSYKYDANHNLVKLTDTLGQVTQYACDADNEVTQITRADGSMLIYSYDNDGNQTAQKDGLGNTTTYAYDPLDRLISTTDPLNRKTGYSYDLAGNLTTLTNPSGQVTTYAYDTADELVKISYSSGHTPQVTFTYNADSERVSMVDGTGKTTYSYDSLNRLVKSTNGAGSTVSYTYDLNSNLTRLTYPGGKRINRTYDAAGHMISVKDWLGNTTKFTYDADGNMIGETYANKVKATFKYDQNDQLTSIVDKLGATQILSLTYTRNNSGLLSSLKAGAPAPGNESYTYTMLDQLNAVNQQAFAYDKADNLVQDGATALAYNAANELTSTTNNNLTTTFSYDAQGNRIQMTSPTNQVTNYTYDQANRLIAYGSSATYSYNGDGLRMSKTVSGTTEAFTWDTAEGLPQVLQDSTTQYVYGPAGMLLEQVSSNGTVLYYHQDQLGSTRVLTNATGTTVATYSYDAYGNVTAQTGSVTNPFQYAGQYTDEESGLQYLRARYYDPATGQFLTRDPLAAQTQEPYGYTGGDPLNASDPRGLTGGLCLGGNGSEGAPGNGRIADYCLVADSSGQIAITVTTGSGYQTPFSGVAISSQTSNASTVQQLQGSSNYIGGGCSSNSYIHSTSSDNIKVDESSLISRGHSFGSKDTEFHEGKSHTTVYVLPRSLFITGEAIPLAKFIAANFPGAAIASGLAALVQWIIDGIEAAPNFAPAI
jgi:RHS repeat-associated protein